MTKSKSPKKKGGMARIFELAAERKGLLTLSGILSATAAIASFVPYIAIYLMIREIILVYPSFELLNRSAMTQYGLLALAGIAADVLCYLASSVCAHIVAFGTQYELKSNFTSHLARIPLGYHLKFGSGRLRKVIDEDIDKIESFLAHSFPDIVASFTAPVIMLVLMFVFDWRFGLAALLAVIVAFAMQMLTFGAAGLDLMTSMQKSMADMTGASVEYVRGMPVLKAFGRTASSFHQLRNAINTYTQFMLTYTLKWENYTAAFQTVANNAYLFILPVGILIGRSSQDYLTFAMTFIFYLLFAPSMASVLNKLMYVASSSMRISGGVANFDNMMSLQELSADSGGELPETNDVVFDSVSFSYDENGAAALTKVSFTAKAGEVTAIVGPSGSGKSTIAHLIPRFWDVSDGAVYLGGVNIRALSEEELMKRVSFVFQDVYLFGQSIKENIRMGSPDATDEDVIKASKAAQCDDFVMRLPKGYETVVGEDGVHLSGGERQRIAIARAIIQNAPVLVLDEATSFADPENERLIQQALSELIRNKTVIMIAHRLGTVLNANKIIVMENGMVSEYGTHDILMHRNGLYYKMWKNYTEAIHWRLGGGEEITVNG
ncbi:ATP-binding cassette subfamily B protein [Ruminiclostridium sufflavum DSM 19573]|uniref:ATP-binding cassette subfamily B protein n=1 Tax=Ruminiclostridium sufflavum DSM 19573 TaxID=1121337 RepID=A0A318XSR7_9FIRM|nr:ABC transporter ATP-binding protein [Ruminiclostridium sufflavum]PYG89742.1 ATP-binding cassette subfamily B protein [Ruminiclostridium sufflavum DSM 19573]